MIPKVILHNAISLDGSTTQLDVNLETFYKLSNKFKPDLMLVGSETAITGIKTYEKNIPEETQKDFYKAEIDPKDKTPLWAIVDSSGKLNNLLHVYRQSGYCKDVIVFISNRTNDRYKRYLQSRQYDFWQTGNKKADLAEVMNILVSKYNIKTILVDSGGELGNELLKENLVDQISLYIHPTLVGTDGLNLFRNLEIDKNIDLRLNKCTKLDIEYVHLLYDVIKS